MILTFLKLLAAIAAMVALVPLSTLAATCSWRRAWESLVGYGRAMGVILLLAAVMAVVVLAGSAIS